jgi:chromosome segregation ATPase
MLLDAGIEDDMPRSHSPFKGVAGKQTFFEQPDNEKEYSQDDMSLKNQRNYENFQFDEEPYVPVAVAQKHISLMEADMRRMKDNYSKTMVDLEAGYIRLEEKTRDIYKRTLGAWRGRAKDKIKQFQDALKKSIDERNEIESNLKERLRKQRIEKERLEKEKAFLLGENEIGKEQIQKKARLLDEIKATYTTEITDRDKVIDQRDEQIIVLRDEHEQARARLEDEKIQLSDEHKIQLAEIKKQLDNETTKNEELEERISDLENQVDTGVVAGPVERQTAFERPATAKSAKSSKKVAVEDKKIIIDDNVSENSDINSLMEVKHAVGESAALVNVAPVAAANVVNSDETKELLERIDALEIDKAQTEEDKIELAKAVTSLNELLKECRSQMKIQKQQIDDAQKQGAEILDAEVAEERSKMEAKKASKLKKKKSSIRVDDEDDVFNDNEDLKKMVENLVPEEDREDAVAEAKAIMLVHNAKNEDLEDEIKRLSKQNDMLTKSLQEMKRRDDEPDGETLDSLQEENKAYIVQIKTLRKKIKETENEHAEAQAQAAQALAQAQAQAAQAQTQAQAAQAQAAPSNVNENNGDEEGSEKVSSDKEVKYQAPILPVAAVAASAGPCQN